MSETLQAEPILQAGLPEAPWMSPATARLPGTGPVAPGDWLQIDEAYAAQMALRDGLIARCPDRVHALAPAAAEAARELLDTVLAELARLGDFKVGAESIVRPDGVEVDLDRKRPLLTLGRLVQQDFCLLQRHGAEHVLTGAILCFPASWSLDEKFGRPLTAIHAPVAEYDADIARRVQRLFDAVRPGAPLRRVNLLPYDDPALFQPRREADSRRAAGPAAAYLRSERQCISRLPESRAIVFAIHTRVVRRDDLPRADRMALAAHLGGAA